MRPSRNRLLTMFLRMATRWAEVRLRWRPRLRCRIRFPLSSELRAGALDLHPERQTEFAQFALDLIERSLAEIPHQKEPFLVVPDEVGDGADLFAFQAVRRTDAEFEFADRQGQLGAEVLGEHRPDRRQAAGGLRLLQFGAELELLDERVEVLAEDLGRLDEREFRRQGAVGPDFEDEPVVVRPLADARVLGLRAHADDRREDRVNRDAPDLQAFLLVLLGGPVAAALLGRHLALEVHDLGERGQVQVLVDDVHVGVAHHVGAGDVALLLDVDAQDGRLVALHADAELLDVEDDVGDVLEHAVHRAELVEDVLELDRGDGGSFERGEQDAAQAVADGGAEAALERLDEEPRVTVRLRRLVADDLGSEAQNLSSEFAFEALPIEWAHS